jgi:hypothetical protein
VANAGGAAGTFGGGGGGFGGGGGSGCINPSTGGAGGSSGNDGVASSGIGEGQGANAWGSSTTLPSAAGALLHHGGNAGLIILTYFQPGGVCSL